MYIKTSLNNDGILTITLSRPEALNALNSALLKELSSVMADAFSNKNVRGIILTGDGDKAFVAGADIKELTALDPQQIFELSVKGQQLFKSIEDSPKPVIAVINGFTLGGGCELAMACHMRIATEISKFGQPEVNLGLIPGYGGTQRLTQLVGRAKALELILTGDMIAAQEAKTLGLINHVVATKEEAMILATKILDKIATKGPIAVANVIKSVNAGFNFEQQGYETEAKLFAECSKTHDFKEGTTAFIEKRKAQFKGE
ncbi:enoyl-CoA hydratase/isomerase family protein [Chryseosolibacter indicus]|uniref:Enoyl-CoA hydratase/isomerase family protein n=1 Tax=Chryseosolibacter indicus TaxID=2782351 RepID=A0ABS5VT28_9BACT|nr:enoyl-CoA hydratase-related protein [Chryseosolibacter indicus]MBT1704351.1 enoyl-CoA hydratase/isomerase family protein [Chryseosolibacter indicus]